MDKFIVHTGKAVVLNRTNVDTDQIIPKQFLKRIERTGFGPFLFFDWRYQGDGITPNPDFELNQPQASGATVLVAGKNFGCGSSREHAPWALHDYGIKAIIAPSYADIFYNNCTKNGMLPVVLSEEQVEVLMASVVADPETPVTVDLPNLRVTHCTFSATFTVDPFRRECLLNGWDDIGLTLHHADAITAYENRREGAVATA